MPTPDEPFDAALRQYAPADPAAREFADPALQQWIADQPDAEAKIAEGLARSQDEPAVLRAYAIAAQRRPSTAQTAALCAALDRRREDVDHDAIVAALVWIHDPAAIDALARAVAFEPPGDRWAGFGGRAIVALERIGTPEARAAIDRAMDDDLYDGLYETGNDSCRCIDQRLRALERLRDALPAGLPEPATEAQVRRLEARAGHPMPPLLRRTYLDLANGGWGPKPGVYGIETAVAVHERLSRPEPPRAWALPGSVVPLLHAGAGRYFCVNYTHESGPMDLIDLAADDGGYHEATVWRGFMDEFVDRWLDGELDRYLIES